MPDKKYTTNISEKEGDKQDVRNQTLDPTSRTIEYGQRETSHLKELAFIKIEGIEKAIDTAHDDLVRVPTEVQKQIASIKELFENKIEYESKLSKQQFEHIYERFGLIEKFRLELKSDYKEALSAALNAAKEAVLEQNKSAQQAITKSETATAKQISSLDEKISDVKDRQTRSEGKGQGVNQFVGWIIAALAVLGFIIDKVITK